MYGGWGMEAGKSPEGQEQALYCSGKDANRTGEGIWCSGAAVIWVEGHLSGRTRQRRRGADAAGAAAETGKDVAVVVVAAVAGAVVAGRRKGSDLDGPWLMRCRSGRMLFARVQSVVQKGSPSKTRAWVG